MPDGAAAWRQPDSEDIDVLIAEWVLGCLAPEAVPDLAVAALQDGCECGAVAVLAGLTRPTRTDVDDELPALLAELRRARPTELEALKTLVDGCVARIVAGTQEPGAGAERIRELWVLYADRDSHVEAWIDLCPFLGPGSEPDNDGPDVEARAAEIVKQSAALLSRGGLNISSRLGPGQLDGRVIRESRLQGHVSDNARLPLRPGAELRRQPLHHVRVRRGRAIARSGGSPTTQPTTWERMGGSRSVMNGSRAMCWDRA